MANAETKLEHNSSRRKPFDTNKIFNVFGILILAIATLASIYPIFWMIMGSFKTNHELFMQTLALPEQFDFAIFPDVWVRANFSTAAVNSLLIVIGRNIAVLIPASMAAFVLSRVKFGGSKVIMAVLAASVVISGQFILIPLFFVINDLNLFNTLWAPILAGSAIDMPITILLFIAFFREIPFDIEESAMLDGCTKVGFFLRFIIPLSKPIVATIVIFVSLWSWNEYLYALTFLHEDSVRTIPLQLQNFRGRWAVEYNGIFASLSLAIVPLIILYVFMQKSFVKGLTAGAVKM